LIVIIEMDVELNYWSFSRPLKYYTWDLEDKVEWFYGRKPPEES